MDRNQIIGLSLITGLMFAYFGFMATMEPETPKVEPKSEFAKKDSSFKISNESAVTASDSSVQNQLTREYGSFATAMSGTSKDVVVENNDIVVTFSTKGARIYSVELKNYKTYDAKRLFIYDNVTNNQSLVLQTKFKPVDLFELFYAEKVTKNADETIVEFVTQVGAGQTISQIYTIKSKGFVVDYKLVANGFTNELPTLPLTYNWQQQVKRIETDPEQARIKTTVNYYNEDGFDYLSEASKDEEKETLNEATWLSLKQRFFNSAIIATNKSKLENINISAYPLYGNTEGTQNAVIVNENTQVIKGLTASFNIPFTNFMKGDATYAYYFGPNQYTICKNINKEIGIEGFEKNVSLGWPLTSWINRFIVIPVFNFLEQSITHNYGLIIFILVVLIKLLLFPLSWKSYISMAKMKALKPELDEIKEKHGDNQQAVQMENMQLYQQVGINPLSGCIPLLLQMPILLAMFNFFPNSIELRGESLFWATDLSTYDVFYNLPFTIPFYGAHVSMFTLLMTISTLLLTFMNNQMSTAAGPMKYMSYAMPVVFMFVLNSFPAGLSFYYLVSNIVSIVQQAIIKRFVDEDALRAQLVANKNKSVSTPDGAPKKNRFMARMEEAMKQRENQQQFNKKNKK